MTSKAKRH